MQIKKELLEQRLYICEDNGCYQREIARTQNHPLQQKQWYFRLYL